MLHRLIPCLLLALTWFGRAHAASFDPRLEWRTLETPHFNITFHQGEAALAEEVAAIAEAVYDKMTAELQSVPKRPTELVLIDPTDLANGYATPIPVNTIVIFVTTPTENSVLSRYEDWNDAILTHEFTHTLHLDTIEGLPKLLRLALGRVVNVHRVSPGWMIEGLATLQETRHTNGGRGRSTMADMVKRMAVIEEQFPPLGNMDGFQVDPPSGNLRYLFGQDFQQYIADSVGHDVWTKWLHAYGGGIPYWLPSKRVFGKRLVTLYREWRAYTEAKYASQVEAIRTLGETATNLVSDGEASCMGPTWAPDGEQLVFSCAHPVDGPAIWIRSKGETKRAVKGAFAQDFTWRSDSRAFFYSATHTVDRFNLYDDVYFHKVGKGTSELVTRGLRVRQPTLSPDGKSLVVVKNKTQENQLSRLTVDKRLDVMARFDRHAQVANPEFSPSGSHIALSIWQDGVRDIWIYDAAGQPYRRVTADTAHDMDPTWSADGRWLYWASDRSGVFNIYATELETEAVYQVTNVVGGAFHPAPHPDGTRLAFESFSNNGPDIVEIALGLNHWRRQGQLATPLVYTGPLADTQDLSREAAPPPEKAEQASPSTKRRRTKQPGGLARDLPIEALPALQGYGAPFQGFDQLPVFRNPWLDAPETAADVEHAEVESEADEDTEEDFPFTYPVRRYRPSGTLFPPRYLLPGATLLYGDTLMAMVSTSSWDTLMRWFYGGYLSYQNDNHYVGWGLSVAYNKLLPVFTAGAYSYTVPYGKIFVESTPPSRGGSWTRSISETPDTYFDKRTVGYLNMALPMSDQGVTYLRWEGTHRGPLQPLSDIDAQGAPVYRQAIPLRGFLSSIGGGWGKGRGTAYGRAVSVERGSYYGLSGKVTSKHLGSYRLDELDQRQPFSQFQFGGKYRRFTPVPWFDDHVVSLSLSGGGSVGDRTRFGSYRLGGNFGVGGIYTLPEEYRPLRGFFPATVYGDWYYLGSAEYRMPLWWIDRGVGTIPFFARYFSLAAFVDAGNAFNELPNGDEEQQEPILSQTLVGSGLEIRGSAIIGYGMSLTMRLGYGFAVRGPGVPLGSPDGIYLRFDTGF